MYYKQNPSCFKTWWTTALDFIWENFSFFWVFIVLFSNTVVYPHQQYLFLNGSKYTHVIWMYSGPQMSEEKIRKAIKNENKILASEWLSTEIFHKWKLENISVCGLGVLTAFKMHILLVSDSQSGIWGPWDYISESLWNQNCSLSITWKTWDNAKMCWRDVKNFVFLHSKCKMRSYTTNLQPRVWFVHVGQEPFSLSNPPKQRIHFIVPQI